AAENAGIKRLQRKVDARHLEARLFQPCGGLRERERLAPQFVRIDEHRLERRISLRAPHGLQGNSGERGRKSFGCVKDIVARGLGIQGRPSSRLMPSNYFDFGRCSIGPHAGSRLAPAPSMRLRYRRHISSWWSP